MHTAEHSGMTKAQATKASQDRLVKLTKWLGDSETSTPEKTWREVAMEDYRFYSGDQDSAEVKEKLEEENRPAFCV